MRCPSCASEELFVFYEQQKVPVNSVLLIPTREEALAYPKGDIALGLCQACGFISNTRFNPQLLEYSSRYESTQGFSPTFNAYHQGLAERLIGKYNLYRKEIIEIGCGQGEFLRLICRLGENRGIGFDPVVNDQQLQDIDEENITFIKDFYSQKYSHYSCDFICCKMTLEHIHEPAIFLNMIRESLQSQPGTLVFFQVPDVMRILEEVAFWDIYYEHCSYFSPGSLARLFRNCGFEILDLDREYGDQYITITAKAGNSGHDSFQLKEDLHTIKETVKYFSNHYEKKINLWQAKLEEIIQKQQKAVVWGASSKSVAFLSSLSNQDAIKYTIDINPNKYNTYIAGTGQKIVGPEFLKEYKPDIVIVMNPIYQYEIRTILKGMECTTQIICV